MSIVEYYFFVLYKYCTIDVLCTSQFQLRSSPPPSGRTPGNLTFQKTFGQITHFTGKNHRQILQGAGEKHGQMPFRPG